MISPKLALMLFAITISTSFNFGYQTGVINAPSNLISDFIGNITVSRYGSVTPSYITAIFSLCVSGFLIGGLFGALSSGTIANKFGRKRSILLLCIPCLIGCVLLVASKTANSFEMIIIGRVLIGIACGAYTAIGPMYMTEVSPIAIRGGVGVLNQLVIVTSIVFSQLLGLPMVLNTDRLWPLLLAFNALPCIVGALCLLNCPESPRYLFLVRNNPVAAREALLRLRGSSFEVQLEMDEFSKETELRTEKAGVFDIWKVTRLRWALFVAVIAQVGQQLCGINGLFYYSVELFQSNGLDENQATYANIGIGGVLLGVTVISIFIIDRMGRRKLLIGGFIISFFSLIVFTSCLIARQVAAVHWPVYLAIVAIYIFVCGFAIGPGSIPWFIVAELFTQETRDAAISVAVTVNWVCNISLGLGFIHLIKYLNVYSFLPSVVILFIVIILLFLYMPETMGRTVAAIEVEFDRRLRVVGRRFSPEDDAGADTSNADTNMTNIYNNASQGTFLEGDKK